MSIDQETTNAELESAKAEVAKGRVVTVSFTPKTLLGRSAIAGKLNDCFRMNGRLDAEVRLVGARKLLAERGYPEALLAISDEDEPVRKVMFANPDITYSEAARLAYETSRGGG
jgi:hypothetical protein